MRPAVLCRLNRYVYACSLSRKRDVPGAGPALGHRKSAASRNRCVERLSELLGLSGHLRLLKLQSVLGTLTVIGILRTLRTLGHSRFMKLLALFELLSLLGFFKLFEFLRFLGPVGLLKMSEHLVS